MNNCDSSLYGALSETEDPQSHDTRMDRQADPNHYRSSEVVTYDPGTPESEEDSSDEYEELDSSNADEPLDTPHLLSPMSRRELLVAIASAPEEHLRVAFEALASLANDIPEGIFQMCLAHIEARRAANGRPAHRTPSPPPGREVVARRGPQHAGHIHLQQPVDAAPAGLTNPSGQQACQLRGQFYSGPLVRSRPNQPAAVYYGVPVYQTDPRSQPTPSHYAHQPHAQLQPYVQQGRLPPGINDRRLVPLSVARQAASNVAVPVNPAVAHSAGTAAHGMQTRASYAALPYVAGSHYPSTGYFDRPPQGLVERGLALQYGHAPAPGQLQVQAAPRPPHQQIAARPMAAPAPVTAGGQLTSVQTAPTSTPGPSELAGPRWATCVKCKREFDVAKEPVHGECRYHSGVLEPIPGAFQEGQESAWEPVRSAAHAIQFASKFVWTCCGVNGTYAGCVMGKHVPGGGPRGMKRARVD